MYAPLFGGSHTFGSSRHIKTMRMCTKDVRFAGPHVQFGDRHLRIRTYGLY
jgi:hypothetical protein